MINLQHAIDIFNIYGGEKSLKCSEIGGHNSKRPKRLNQEIANFFEKYLYNNDIKKENNNNNNELNQSFVFKTNEYSKDRDRYNFQKEENEQKNIDEIKNILLNIKENDLNKE